jgi:hypothetical protein
MKYAILISNLDNLDAYEDKIMIQKLFRSSIDFLNRLFDKEIEEKVEINSGDMSAVFKNTDTAFLYYRLLVVLLYPLKIKSGLSFGKINELQKVLENALTALNFCINNNYDIILGTEDETDKFLNMFFLMRTEMRSDPSIPANLIQLFSEFLFPLKGDFSILKRQDMIARLSLILKFKSDLYQYLIEYPDLVDLNINLERNKFPIIDYGKYIDYIQAVDLIQTDFSEDYQILYNSFWKKGFSTKVGEILGITRQIVDRNYRYLNFAVLRNLDATITTFLKSKV